MKSYEVQLNEALTELSKLGREDEVREARVAYHKEHGKPMPIAKQVTLAQEMLEVSTRTIRKHNGAGDNGHIFTESAGMELTADEVAALNNTEATIKNYMLTCGISESDARKVLGLAPKEIVALGRHAIADYKAARSFGFSEADAVIMVKTGKMGRKAQMYAETA